MDWLENYDNYLTDVSDDELNNRFSAAIVQGVKLVCMNLFKWENLPDTIEPWMLENWLFNLGWVGFGYDEKYNYIALWANPNEIMDLTYRPTRLTLTGNGGVFNRLVYYGSETEKTLIIDRDHVYSKDTACVLIKNNDLYQSTIDLIFPYIYTYYLAKRKEITTLHQLQLQSLIMASNEDRATIEIMNKNIRKNKPIVSLNVKGMKYEPRPLNLANNSSLLDLNTFAKSIYGEIMEHIGIESINYEKAERLITSEVDKNKQQTEAGIFPLLRTRKEAADLINELFGLNIKVSINDEIKVSRDQITTTISAQDKQTQNMGGTKDEKVN